MHDEKDAWEFPSRFDSKDIEKRARRVFEDVRRRFGDMDFEDWQYNQDASFGLAIIFRLYEKKEGMAIRQPVIRFSNFGNLATFTFEEMLPEDARTVIEESLTRNGFFYIEAEELESPYDGVMSPNGSIPTWWVRYFDYL